MRKWLILLLLPFLVSNVWAVRTSRPRVAILTHSVGMQIMDGTTTGETFWNHIADSTIIAGGLQMTPVIRHFNKNTVPGLQMSDTVSALHGRTPFLGTENSFTGIGWKIWTPTQAIPPLVQIFNSANQNLAATTDPGEIPIDFDLFGHVKVRSSAGNTTDSVYENFDIVMTKPPYFTWQADGTGPMNQTRSDYIKNWYLALRDTVANHPEINFVVIWGTPLVLDDPGSTTDFAGNTTAAQYAYDLAGWARTTLVPHDNDSRYRNFWCIEFYQALCNTTPGSAYYFGLDQPYASIYNGSATGQSHLSSAGSQLGQDSLVAGTIRVLRDWAIQKNTDRRTKSNTSEDPGWPMDDDAAVWPAGVPKANAAADSIKDYQARLVAARYEWTTNGAPEQINRIKAYNSNFRHYQYNSFQDNYVHTGDLDEQDWLQAWCAANGRRYEELYLHYYDPTTINIQGVNVSVPGVSSLTATAADSASSRVFVYYSNKSRAVPNYSIAWVRQAIREQARYSLTHLEPGFNYYPDGIFWDNSQIYFWNDGTVVTGGTVAEHPTRASVSMIGVAGPSPGDGWWYTAHMKPFFQEHKADLEVSATWPENTTGKKKKNDLNTSGIRYDLMAQDRIGYGFGHEFQYSTVGAWGGAYGSIAEVKAWGDTCQKYGIGIVHAPSIITTGGGGSTQTFVEAMHNNLCLFYLLSDDSAHMSVMPEGAAGTSNFQWDTLVWVGSYSRFIGRHGGADRNITTVVTAADPLAQAYTIYSRNYPADKAFAGAKVFVRPCPASHNIGAGSAVTLSLGGMYRELLADGSFAQPVQSTTFKAGQGRIFVPVGAAAATAINGVTPTATCLDCSGSSEADNFRVDVVTGSEVLTNGIIEVAWSITAQPSTWTTIVTGTYTPSTTVPININGVVGTEDYTLYVAARVRKTDGTFTPTVYGSVFNNQTTPPLTALSVDSVEYTPGATVDQYRVFFSTPNVSLIDNIGFGFSTVSAASITVPTQTVTYVPNLTNNSILVNTITAIWPYTFYVKGWLIENGENSTPLTASYTFNVSPVQNPPTDKTRIRGNVRIKGAVRIK